MPVKFSLFLRKVLLRLHHRITVVSRIDIFNIVKVLKRVVKDSFETTFQFEIPHPQNSKLEFDDLYDPFTMLPEITGWENAPVSISKFDVSTCKKLFEEIVLLPYITKMHTQKCTWKGGMLVWWLTIYSQSITLIMLASMKSSTLSSITIFRRVHIWRIWWKGWMCLFLIVKKIVWELKLS